MYSGSDSTESQNINQWPLNPAAYQNTPNEQIDWAALAQQWIIMKEAGPPVPDQIVNPTPLASNNQKPKNEIALSEGGEAPMEVENDKDDDGPQPQWNETSLPDGSWSWNQQWNWGNTWSAPTGIPPPSKAPLLPTPIPYNQFSNTTDNATNFAGTTSNDYSSNYWTGAGSKMKTHNKRFNKVNLPTRPPIPSSTLPDPVMLDASKRKQLPAWIREGLEKMERDKQKQMEKEREKQEQVEIVEKSKLNEKEAMEIIKRTVKEREKSKFDSDAEESDNSLDGEKSVPIVEPVILTQDELMMKLRRTMTEILLNVTNQEIRAVCKEEFQRHLRKNKASDLHVSASSGTYVTGKLGLGIYGDSGSSSEEDNNSDQNRNDSDNELKNVIRKKKADFVKTEREIEDRLSAANKYANNHSRGGTPTADDCDSQVDAKGQGLKLKSHQEETSVKVVSKRLKSRRDSTSSFSKSDSDQDKGGRNKERRKSKRSSSSESDYKKSKSKYKRTKRSRSSEKDRIKDKRRSSERKSKVSESGSSKSSSLRSRKSRSKSVDSVKKKKRSIVEKLRQERNSKRSRSRSSSRSRRSRSYSKRRRSISRSSVKSEKKRKSRSRTRSGYSDVKTDRLSSRSRRSRSYNRRSRTPDRSSWRRSKSQSPPSRRRRRSWSNESGRGNRRRH